MSAPFLWRKLFGDDTSATKLLSGLLPWSGKAPLAPGAASAGTAEVAAREDHVHPLPTKLLTARTLDGVSFDGSGDLSRYALCSTAGATVAKTVTVSNFLLKVGAVVVVKFAETNTAASPTLNVSGTGAKGIFWWRIIGSTWTARAPSRAGRRTGCPPKETTGGASPATPKTSARCRMVRSRSARKNPCLW